MSIIDNAKELSSLIKKLGDIELYRKIVELEGEVIELTRTNRELDLQLSEMKGSAEILSTLTHESNFYIGKHDKDLYCMKCAEKDKIAVHLKETGALELRRRIWECPNCNNAYTDMRRG